MFMRTSCTGMSFPFSPGEQERDMYAAQHHKKLKSDLLLLCFPESIDDAFNGLRGAVGVAWQRRGGLFQRASMPATLFPDRAFPRQVRCPDPVGKRFETVGEI